MTAIVFSCSGASDVGEIADRAARKLSREGAGKMHCMTAVAAGVESFMKFYQQTTDPIVAIDGCALACASECVKQAGLSVSQRLCLGDLGFAKGESPPTDERIDRAADAAGQLIAKEPAAR
jgi:uncharacterized metal-binding protein